MCHLYRLRIKTHVLTLHHALCYRAPGYIPIFTARKRSCLKIMFLHLSVILFTGGGCTSPRQTPHQADSPPRWALKWAVRIRLECIVVLSVIPICPIEKNRNLVINRTYEWTITSRYQEAKGPQWQVQDFHKVGVATLGGDVTNIRFCQNFPKTASNWKNLDPEGARQKLYYRLIPVQRRKSLAWLREQCLKTSCRRQKIPWFC